jgi:hypothetical protein
MNRKRVWRLCTLLPDLPGDSEVASLRIPGPSGIQQGGVLSPVRELGGEFLASPRFFGKRMK